MSKTLEEANEWFRGYETFLKHNERALWKHDVQVNQALLNKSIISKLSLALRALPGLCESVALKAAFNISFWLFMIYINNNSIYVMKINSSCLVILVFKPHFWKIQVSED